MGVTIWDLENHRKETLSEEQRSKLLPASIAEYDIPPVDSILYDRKRDSRSGICWGYLKEEFWELEHDDPHKAPHELRVAHVKAEVEKLLAQNDVTLEDIIRTDPPEDSGATDAVARRPRELDR